MLFLLLCDIVRIGQLCVHFTSEWFALKTDVVVAASVTVGLLGNCCVSGCCSGADVSGFGCCGLT